MRPQPSDATKSPWTHDLHETLHHDTRGVTNSAPTSMPAPPVVGASRSVVGAPGQAPVRNYSTTRDMAYTQVRVRIPDMKEPVTYANTLIKQYTKLPDHRPPLRRDKPVRISLPDKAPRYIFPAVDRSFIFIPRALRPNQQGFGRGRSRLGSIGGFSSRRTSVFGGSVYAPSVPASRRSSFGREFNNGALVSPAGSVRPIVRMPPGSQQHTAVGTPLMMSGHGTPVMNQAPMHYYPHHLPQKPAYRENWPQNMPMHQPRPQKTVSVAGIESPASQFQPPPHELQPFSHQLPAHVNGGQVQDGNYYRQPPQQQYQGQTTGTPLQNIPERAIHAPAFQPYAQQQPFQPGGYYYPQPAYAPTAVIAPMVVQNGQHGSYIVPTLAPEQPAAVYGHEQNGMVFYSGYDPSNPPPPVQQPQQQQQMYEQVPQLPQQGYAGYGMGGMMTPAPEGAYYYPQQVLPAGTVYYQQ